MDEDESEKCCICKAPTPNGGINGACYPCWTYDRLLPPFDLRTSLEEAAIADLIRKKEGH